MICIDVPVSSLYLLPVDHSSAPRGCARIVKLIFFSPCSHSSLVPPLPLAALETTLYGIFNFVSYCCSVAKSCPALCDPWTSAQQSPLFFTVSQSLLRFMSIELVMLFNHLVLCRLLLPLPSVFSSIKVFSNESALHLRWPKYWSFSFSISPSNEYSGLISFMIDWFDYLLLVLHNLYSCTKLLITWVDNVISHVFSYAVSFFWNGYPFYLLPFVKIIFTF